MVKARLDYLKVEVLPYIYAGQHGGEERTYRVKLMVNGDNEIVSEVHSVPPSYMSEIEFTMRIVRDIEHTLRKKYSEDKESK